MQNRILLVITIVLSLILVVLSSSKNTTFFNNESNKNEISINVKDTTTSKIDKMDLEEYVIGVVAAEMPASFNNEALKAQAIASRTYAMYKINNSKKDFDVVTDVSNQSYITIDEMKNKWQNDFDKYYEKVKNAVNETEGLVITYNDEIIESYYFAMSNGYTENASLVFMEDRDYLESVESIYDNESLNNFKVTFELSKIEFCKLLEIDCSNIEISNTLRSNTNRVNSITINNKNFKGTEVRSKLSLRSTDFDITLMNDKVVITTKGYGHGVGMSQYGANGMANAGMNYKDILKYFYKNTEISSI